MDWSQYITFMATMLGALYAFYQITKQEIGIIREQINVMETHHREDIRAMDDRIGKLDEKFETRFLSIDARFLAIDEKWERLFEKLLLSKK
jgi:hypothetical protein